MAGELPEDDFFPLDHDLLVLDVVLSQVADHICHLPCLAAAVAGSPNSTFHIRVNKSFFFFLNKTQNKLTLGKGIMKMDTSYVQRKIATSHS